MPWFKVDDTVAFHGKVVAAGNAAMGLWVRSGSWSAQMLTDGNIPTHMVAALAGTDDAHKLVEAGLWIETPEGFVFKDWDHYQFTKEEVEAKRAVEREKKRRQREAGTAAASRGQDGRFTPTSPSASPRDNRGESRGESSATHPVPSQPSKNTPATPGGFDEFWAMYPKKVGKGQAVKAYRAAVKRADTEAISDGLASAIQAWKRAGTEERFIPNPATWLNGERWTDEAPVMAARPEDEWVAPPPVDYGPRCDECNRPGGQHFRGCSKAAS